MSTAAEDLPHRHWMTVGEYYRMAEVGLLKPDAHVELIEGEIIDMAPIGHRHASAVNRLDRLLQRAVEDSAHVSVQAPVRMSEWSEPEPDIALLKPRPDFYAAAHPGPTDTLLIVEVSDTTLHYDLKRKAPLYARHGIPEVWIVDLTGKQLSVLRAPRDSEYTEVGVIARPGMTDIAQLPGVAIDLSWLLTM